MDLNTNVNISAHHPQLNQQLHNRSSTKRTAHENEIAKKTSKIISKGLPENYGNLPKIYQTPIWPSSIRYASAMNKKMYSKKKKTIQDLVEEAIEKLQINATTENIIKYLDKEKIFEKRQITNKKDSVQNALTPLSNKEIIKKNGGIWTLYINSSKLPDEKKNELKKKIREGNLKKLTRRQRKKLLQQREETENGAEYLNKIMFLDSPKNNSITEIQITNRTNVDIQIMDVPDTHETPEIENYDYSDANDEFIAYTQQSERIVEDVNVPVSPETPVTLNSDYSDEATNNFTENNQSITETQITNRRNMNFPDAQETPEVQNYDYSNEDDDYYTENENDEFIAYTQQSERIVEHEDVPVSPETPVTQNSDYSNENGYANDLKTIKKNLLQFKVSFMQNVYSMCPFCFEIFEVISMVNMPKIFATSRLICRKCFTMKFNNNQILKANLQIFKKESEAKMILYQIDTFTIAGKNGLFIFVCDLYSNSFGLVSLILAETYLKGQLYNKFRAFLNYLDSLIKEYNMLSVAQVMDNSSVFGRCLSEELKISNISHNENQIYLDDIFHDLIIIIRKLGSGRKIKFSRINFEVEEIVIIYEEEEQFKRTRKGKTAEKEEEEKEEEEEVEEEEEEEEEGEEEEEEEETIGIKFDPTYFEETYPELTKLLKSNKTASSIKCIKMIKMFFRKIKEFVANSSHADTQKEQEQKIFYILEKIFFFSITNSFFNDSHKRILEESKVLLKRCNATNNICDWPEKVLKLSIIAPRFYIPAICLLFAENGIQNFKFYDDVIEFCKQTMEKEAVTEKTNFVSCPIKSRVIKFENIPFMILK